jgi:hypothetical protein
MPSDDFLRIVVRLKNEIDASSFTELFVRVCAYTKIDDLEVTDTMVQSAVDFLNDKRKNEKAAYGLMRMIYKN